MKYIYPITYFDQFVPESRLMTMMMHEEKIDIEAVMEDIIKEAETLDVDLNDWKEVDSLLIKRGFKPVNYQEVVFGPDKKGYKVWRDFT